LFEDTPNGFADRLRGASMSKVAIATWVRSSSTKNAVRPDPIYSAIDAHKAAHAVYLDAEKPLCEYVTAVMAEKGKKQPKLEKGAPDSMWAARMTAAMAADRLARTEPSTSAGMRALLEYLASPQHGAYDPLASTLLKSRFLAL
jgi:hypothetical protein